LPEAERVRFMLARRLGWIGRLRQLDDPRIRASMDEVVSRIRADGLEPEAVLADLRAGTL
jgi:hypothetical protein